MKQSFLQWIFTHRNEFILPVIVFIAIFSIGWIGAQNEETRQQNERQSDMVRLRVACDVADSTIEELEAIKVNNRLLRDIVRSLGLPIPPQEPIQIPEVPAECVGV
jgi:hypothetical protein